MKKLISILAGIICYLTGIFTIILSKLDKPVVTIGMTIIFIGGISIGYYLGELK